ncbi:ABC transporter substrate-binding protein [Pseudonocardia sp. TRM90224]|uniref:ABC transporter substrate-binding protein n=1 Tax=Pseudonocardia sp. TRM90224 TaxID=2812678 RepID=UPI001E39A310|nr:sugar ABC transporter substrate-binding protein [Pseudonocardia sp. TRM90224]
MKRYPSALAAIATAAAVALAGCSSPATAPADPSGPVTLTVSAWNLESTPEFRALFDAFEAVHPNVTIQPVEILAEDYPEKVATMLAGGDTTDVLTMKNVTDYARYASRGQLLDLTDLVGELPTDKMAGLEPFDIGGKYAAVPYRQDFWLLYYNKKLFDAAGLPHPDQLTWAQYGELAKKLTSGTTADGQKVYGTYHHTWRSVVQAIAAAQTGGDQLGGDYGFMKSQYELALDLQRSGAALDYGTARTQQVNYRSMFETGQTAMLPMGTWYIASIKAAIASGKSSVDWGVAPMPQLAPGAGTTTFGSPTAFAVNEKAKNAEVAKEFVRFAAGEQGAKAIAAIGVVPAFRSDAVTAAFTALPSDELSKKAFTEDKKIVLEMPVSETTSDVDTILTEEHSLIMTGEKPVDDGLREAGDRVKNEVR